MRSSIALFVIVAAFAVLVVAVDPDSTQNDDISHDEVKQGIDLVSSNRFKLATCDIASGIIKGIGHAACGVHCIAKGFRGGWCDKRAACNCRRLYKIKRRLNRN